MIKRFNMFNKMIYNKMIIGLKKYKYLKIEEEILS